MELGEEVRHRTNRYLNKDEDLLKPSAIANALWYLAHQDRSAWTHELDVRPFKEKFSTHLSEELPCHLI